MRGPRVPEDREPWRGMPPPTDSHPPIDPGLASFALVLRVLGIATTPEQIAPEIDLGRRAMTADDMLRCAKRFNLRARLVTTRVERLAKTPLPAVALRPHGGAFVAAQAPGSPA